MKSWSKVRFEQLVHIPAAARAPSGSPAVFILRLPRPPGNGLPETIPAMRALVRRGMDLLMAKRAIEALLQNAEVVVSLPQVEDPKLLGAELAAFGISAALEKPVRTGFSAAESM
jgi:hypothetical protein